VSAPAAALAHHLAAGAARATADRPRALARLALVEPLGPDVDDLAGPPAARARNKSLAAAGGTPHEPGPATDSAGGHVKGVGAKTIERAGKRIHPGERDPRRGGGALGGEGSLFPKVATHDVREHAVEHLVAKFD